MIKTYSKAKDGNVKLSDHFKVSEFACKDGSDKIIIDTDLIPYLENIRQFFNCSKAEIYSGYRTPTWDKKVGGSGSGPHTNGYAVDIRFYDKNNKLIDTKYICCYASDLNMKGIAKCYQYGTHLDTRPRHWWADESNNNKTVSSFYSYFGVKKEELYGKIEPVERDETKNQLMTLKYLNVRKEPSIKGMIISQVNSNILFDDLETKKSDGYTWHRIGENQWVAQDSKNTYLELLPAIKDYKELYEEEVIKNQKLELENKDLYSQLELLNNKINDIKNIVL